MKTDRTTTLTGAIAQHPAAKHLALLALAAALGACAQPSALERSLGESVRQARQQQALSLPAARPDGQPILTDGVIAAQGVSRYQQSWVNPPAPITVLNVQAGGAGQTPAMPR